MAVDAVAIALPDDVCIFIERTVKDVLGRLNPSSGAKHFLQISSQSRSNTGEQQSNGHALWTTRKKSSSKPRDRTVARAHHSSIRNITFPDREALGMVLCTLAPFPGALLCLSETSTLWTSISSLQCKRRRQGFVTDKACTLMLDKRP